MTKNNSERIAFEEQVYERDNNECIIPWCTKSPADAHHIIERACWEDGGYIPQNGVSVCSLHHKYAESSMINAGETETITVESSDTKTSGYIPPQAFWWWIELGKSDEDAYLDRVSEFDSNSTVPQTPSGEPMNIDKWGSELELPPWKEHRERIKYPSTRHLPFSNIGDDDDTYFRQVDNFLGVPLVMTHKMDGSNAMLTRDKEHPVRARNGKHANHESFSLLKDLYWEHAHEDLPNNLQIFGEWMYAKHSIHYGCNCETPCEDVGPALSEVTEDIDDERAYFQIFGVYETTYDFWLSWPEVEIVADELGFPTTPVIEVSDPQDCPRFTNENRFYEEVYEYAQNVIDNGGEGLVVRSKFPFHFSEFERRVGKYVRKNHVKTDEHWSHKEVLPNII